MATLVDPDALQAPAVALKEAIRRDRDLLDKVHTASMSMNICACAHAAACACMCVLPRVCLCVYAAALVCVCVRVRLLPSCVFRWEGGVCVAPAVCGVADARRVWMLGGEQSVRAFVSFVRAYKEHVCSYLFRLRDLDYTRLVRAFGLFRVRPHTQTHTRTQIHTHTQTDTDRQIQTIARQAIVTATMTWPGWRAHADKGGGWVGCSCRACPSCVRSMWPCRPTPWTYAHPAPNRCGCGWVCVGVRVYVGVGVGVGVGGWVRERRTHGWGGRGTDGYHTVQGQAT
jgi:hypothetical protein